ncbi:MAG: error-prone DNA polymerase [Gammaproteobacteria bacterium]|nr:error-prone DNA polymerase [Gammaproteobacteria bacterium]
MKLPPYAELHCLSNYSFLRGASFPEELVERAVHLRYHALAITDECSLAGVVRAHTAAKEHQLHLIIGSEFTLDDQTRLVLLATDRESYGRLSHVITIARRNAEKGGYSLTRQMLEQHHPTGCLALWLPGFQNNHPEPTINDEPLQWLAQCFPHQTWIAVELLLSGNDPQHLQALQAVGKKFNIPLCAAGDAHMHHRSRRALQDTLTAIRLGKPLAELGYALFPNGERALRSRQRLQKIYPRELLEETVRIADRCRFSLDELRYEYPKELVPEGQSPQSWLRCLTEQGMCGRWPRGAPEKVKTAIEHELQLIDEMAYAPYFLTVHDIVRYARSQGILCQGRGSAANSAVCYCLGITEVDPGRMQLLFERFISKERNEPPDIDVDFEHERREEVIQYIYQKYGRERAALAATVITYRPRSAVRDVGKAIGMSLDQVDRLAKSIYWWHHLETLQQQLRENGFDINNPLIQRLVVLVNLILGFPRHLSQHVGGFVISQGKLSHLVPIENAAMAERTVIQWEKDDLEALGLLKIDILALGMLSAIRKALTYISSYCKHPVTLADIPPEDPAVYRMIQRADTIGVFQIESRAQMSMLPRLKPRNYYDLVIEIAIIRPGPIQGDMVHPYLRRRNGEEPVTYPSDAVKDVLSRTLGVPIFQEQVMQLAMVAAGFTAGEADKLRRSMAAWKRKGGLDQFEGKLLQGMKARGYSEQFAQQIFNQIKGFGEYGFPESHSASFALLAYASSWLKRYHPAAFTCALLNSQPMGFYAPAQLIIDARKHGVNVLPIDINHSHNDCALEYATGEKIPLNPPLQKGEEKTTKHPLSLEGESPSINLLSLEGEGWGEGENNGNPPWPLKNNPHSLEGEGDVQGRTNVARGMEKVRPGTGREAGLGHARGTSPWMDEIERCLEQASRATQDAKAEGWGEGENVNNLPTSQRTSTNPPLCKRGVGGDLQTTPSLRLGLRMINGLTTAAINNITQAREQGPFASVQDLATRAQLNNQDLECLAAANALQNLSGDRHRAYWHVAGIEKNLPLFDTPHFSETDVMLPKPSEGQNIIADYATTGLTLGRHPLALLRTKLTKRRIRTAEELWQLPNDTRATVAGLVICRQRPGSAGNVVFVTLEDETGQTNVVIWPKLAEKQAKELLHSRLLAVRGAIQQEDGVLHLIAHRLEDLSPWLGSLTTQSRDFC